jgi:dolichol-phosphate mannosyltransferase
MSTERDIEVSVIAPCCNEEKSLPEFVRRVSAVFLKMKLSFEIVLINDGSRDRTLETARALIRDVPQIKVVDLSRNFGHQAAVTAGMDMAQGKAVIIIDADLQDPPEVIEEMIMKWKEGYEVVYGKRNKREGEGFLKLLTAKLFYRILRFLTNLDIPVDTGDFRLVDRKVVEGVKGMHERHRFIRGMVSWVGFKQVAVIYDRQARFQGKTNYSYSKMLRFAFDAITSFSTVPLRMVSVLGLLILFATLFLVGVILITRIFNPGYFIPGFSAVVTLILFFGGMTLFSIGMLGEYVGRIFEEVKQRPLYIVRDIYVSQDLVKGEGVRL